MRSYIRRHRDKPFPRDRVLDKLLTARKVLALHHTKACYSLKAIALRENMPWGKGRQQQWSSWESWNQTPQKKNRKWQKDLDKEPAFYGYDGKKVKVEDAADRTFGRSSALPSPDNSLKDENKQLKAAMKFVLENMNGKVEIPADIQDLVKEDPRESLRERQKALNQERRGLNRLEKVKDSIEKEECKFRSWKEWMSRGLKQEEKRHGDAVIQLQEQLRSLERQRDGVDPVEVDSESDAEGVKPAIVHLEKEFAGMRQDFKDLTTYTAQLEHCNYQMIDNMHSQMMSMLTKLADNGSLHTDALRKSPEQNIRPKGEDKIPVILTPEKPERRGRSRSRGRGGGGETEKKSAEKQDVHAGLKEKLQGLPEVCQAKILGVLNSNLDSYPTFDSVDKLIQEVMATFNAAGPPGLLPVKKEPEEEKVTPKKRVRDALLPFGGSGPVPKIDADSSPGQVAASHGTILLGNAAPDAMNDME